ncbi:MAG: DMT family transporter [Alphaproteobacteria bacterium]|jgi:transporter family-2 protein
MLSWFLLFMVALAGFLTPVQASVNAILGRSLGHPISAAVISTGVSFSLLMITAVAIRVPLPTAAGIGTPWWIYVTGGTIGAVFVFFLLFSAPIIGATAMIGAIIAGQLLGSVVLDHYGLLGLPQHDFTPGRAAGIAFLVVGVFLIRKF